MNKLHNNLNTPKRLNFADNANKAQQQLHSSSAPHGIDTCAAHKCQLNDTHENEVSLPGKNYLPNTEHELY